MPGCPGSSPSAPTRPTGGGDGSLRLIRGLPAVRRAANAAKSTASVRMMLCDSGNVMGRDRNAAVNHLCYSEEPRKRGDLAPTRVEIGDQELAPVPVVEARILADVA